MQEDHMLHLMHGRYVLQSQPASKPPAPVVMHAAVRPAELAGVALAAGAAPPAAIPTAQPSHALQRAMWAQEQRALMLLLLGIASPPAAKMNAG